MTDLKSPLPDEVVEEINTEIILKLVGAIQPVGSMLEDKYGAQLSISLCLMSMADFCVRSHLVAGMEKETIKELLCGLIDDMEETH